MQERLPGGRSPRGFADYPPDLAVEILSPNQRLQDAGEKVGEFLDWGTPLVWVLDPNARSVTVYRSLTRVYTLGPDDELSDEEVIPLTTAPGCCTIFPQVYGTSWRSTDVHRVGSTRRVESTRLSVCVICSLNPETTHPESLSS